MDDRIHGRSMYHPSQQFRQKETPPPPKPKLRLPKLGKVAYGILGAIVALLLLSALFLGDFRFLLARIPSATGFPLGSRTYLVLFQNNYELRPTGGFISTYGELTFKHGIYRGIEFHDVYGPIDDHDTVEPPLVLAALLDGEGYQGHTFRDANFDPDFRISQDELIEFYQLTNPKQKIDGIIAADFTFLEQLVGLYEPLTVDGLELTEANLFETLSSVASDIDRHNEEALATRKNVAGPIVKKVIRKSVWPWRLRRVTQLTAQAFEEKHLLAAFDRRGLRKSFEKRNWDGALPSSNSGDFLAINDANYGGMKSNRYITRDVLYELEVTSATDVLGQPVVRATTTVTLAHNGGYNVPLSGPYTGYLRVMIPLGADIESAYSISEEREDAQVIGELIELEPGDSITYSYSYELPEYVWQDEQYSLHLHKQPGTDADRYRVVVRVPEGLSLAGDSWDVRENVAFYDTALSTDQDLSFHLLADQNPPRIVFHEITDLNEMTIIFNEPLGPESAQNPLNYDIQDLNYIDQESDALVIEGIRVEGNTVILSTSGMSETPDERYSVTLRDIRDRSSNYITPNPRSVTVIQRTYETEEEEEEIIEEEALPEEEVVTE